MHKPIVAFLLFCLTALPLAAQQTMRQQMQEALATRYRLTVLGARMWKLQTNENEVRRAGGVAVLRRAGISGALDRPQVASYGIKDDKLELYSGKADAPLRVGEKFYVVGVGVGSNVVSLALLSVAAQVTPTRTGQVWTTLNFFFPKEVLDRGDITPVYRVVDQWVLPEGTFQPGGAEMVAATALAPAAAAAPADLKPGMTKEEVFAAIGPPLREASFGTRTWLTYPGLVAVMEGGKLASVDQTSQPPAKISFVSQPEGADVYVDGNFVGNAPTLLQLPAGSYKISVRAHGHKDWEREVKLMPAGEVNIRAVLEKQ